MPAENHMSADHVRDQIRAEWTAQAPKWGGAATRTQRNSPARDLVMAMANIQHGQRVLDLACGSGNAALAQRIGPDGYLLGLDLTPAMVDIGRQWVRDQDLRHVEFRPIANEFTLDVPAASFDAATCTFGLAYMPAPVAALQAVHAALKPGGRIAACTWGRCSFFEVPLAIIGRHVGPGHWDATAPGPFALRDRSAMARCFTDAGFAEVEVQAVEFPMGPSEPEAFWQFAAGEAGGPWQCWPPEADGKRDVIREDALATLRAMFPDGVVRLMGEALVAVGTKAGDT